MAEIEPVSVTDAKSAREYLSRHVNALWLSSAMDAVREHLASASSAIKSGYKDCMNSNKPLTACMRDVASTQGLSIKYREIWGEPIGTR